MKDKATAKVYAKSLMDISLESKIDIVAEYLSLHELINKSNELENLLFLDVFTSDEKWAVLSDLLKKMNSPELVQSSVHFLITEKRINLLPLIVKELVVMDDEKKGFLRGVIEGSEEIIDPNVVAQLKKAIEAKIQKKVELSYQKNIQVTAGYKVTVDDWQLDASLDSQLEKLKQSIVI